MLAHMVGSGAFWLIVWLTMLLLGWKAKNQNAMGVGMIGTVVSASILIALVVTHMMLSG
jgi:hypothetical protein